MKSIHLDFTEFEMNQIEQLLGRRYGLQFSIAGLCYKAIKEIITEQALSVLENNGNKPKRKLISSLPISVEHILESELVWVQIGLKPVVFLRYDDGSWLSHTLDIETPTVGAGITKSLRLLGYIDDKSIISLGEYSPLDDNNQFQQDPN